MKRLQTFNLSHCLVLLQYFTFGICPSKKSSRYARKLHLLGKSKLDKELDIGRILRQLRSLHSFFKLWLSPEEFSLIQYQRSQSVLNLEKPGGSSGSDDGQLNDRQLMQKINTADFIDSVDAAYGKATETNDRLSKLEKLKLGLIYSNWRHKLRKDWSK